MAAPDSARRLAGLTPLRRAILGAVQRRHVASRAEIAAALRLSRSRVSPEVKRLLDQGLLVADGLASSEGGRRSERLRLPGAEAGVVAGIDIDAGYFDIGITDLGSAIIAHARHSADPDDGLPVIVGRVADALEAMLAEHASAPLLAIGVGVSAPVDLESGMTIAPTLIPGSDRFPIRDEMIERFGVPTYVDNDFNALALGEMHGRMAAGRDALADKAAFLCVSVSAGIGAGAAIGGEIYRGEQGCAGYIGHICVDPDSSVVCFCGNRGCLEALAAPPALLERAVELADASSDLRALVERGEPTPADLGRLALRGDGAAIQLIRESGQRIGFVLAGLVSFFNPTEIVINTVFTEATDMLLNEIRQEIYRRSLPLATRELVISASEVGASAGVIGASALAVAGLIDQTRDTLVSGAAERLAKVRALQVA